ncbi:ATP-binding protein [Streptomyces sp. AN091965]|uniref:ATP-binding protein n=1 Tax=Streptomyces sp. AN091965 TaxID=2927803 RepID=UPI001F60C61A|nr:ATP-binding protein [Streptomyces sp. AN091965]MCI3931924.1 ATP-binding protein [Streptomyces sp. AN091965]
MNHATDLLDQGVGGSYRMSFTVGEHSARPLRRILRTYLGRWGLAGLADDAELALTELVANVVRHVPDRRCAVLIVRRPRGLRVEVMDGSPVLPAPAEGTDGEPAEGGHGLRLVAAVTDRWDVTVLPGGAGKTIWFECDDGKGVDGDP